MRELTFESKATLIDPVVLVIVNKLVKGDGCESFETPIELRVPLADATAWAAALEEAAARLRAVTS